MKLFKQLQVGKPMSTETPVLNFLTYYEDSAACRKVTETMLNWCSPNTHSFLPSWQKQRNISIDELTSMRAIANAKVIKWHEEFEQIIFDNVPVKGFTFKGVESRYSTDNKVFRITDPRGFIVEIYADNLMSLMLESNIERGEIMDECIWFRQGAKNYLINVNSSVYAEAIKEVAKEKKVKANMLSITKVKVGDIVKLKSHEDSVYLGRHFVEFTNEGQEYNRFSDTRYLKPTSVISKKKLHIFRAVDTDRWDSGRRSLSYYAVQSPSGIISVVGSKDQVLVDECIADVEKVYVHDHKHGYNRNDDHVYWHGTTPVIDGRTRRYNTKVSKIVVES